jgi:hypothetical protein
MPDDLLVSCLTVTQAKPERLGFLRAAIAAYLVQTYPRRELVIVVDDDPPEIAEAIGRHIATLGRADIRLLPVRAGQSLGALRNLSRAAAAGAVHCQWDDDDLHHRTRIERQLAALTQAGALAVALCDIFQFFPQDRALYWTNWRQTELGVMPGALMVRADAPIAYPETGEIASRGEDSVVCEQLIAAGGLQALADAPELMVYVSHGANTWDDGHHAMLAARLGLSPGLLRRREALIRAALADVDLGPGPIAVRGPADAAFTIEV